MKPDYVVIGEASQLNLKIGQRGRAEIVIETFGKPCHSANPEKGINAVYKMAKVIEAIRTLEPTHHPVLGRRHSGADRHQVRSVPRVFRCARVLPCHL